MSDNVLRQFVGAGGGGGGVGVLVLLTFGGGGGRGVECKIESLQILDLRKLAGMQA